MSGSLKSHGVKVPAGREGLEGRNLASADEPGRSVRLGLFLMLSEKEIKCDDGSASALVIMRSFPLYPM